MSASSLFKIKFIILILVSFSCENGESQKAQILFDQQCARCHIAPDIQDLPREIWEKQILPDMGARMGLPTPGYKPFEGYSYEETLAMMATNTYPQKPVISEREWAILKEYILTLAPDSLRRIKKLPKLEPESEQFDPRPVKLDENHGSYITYLEYLEASNILAIGDMQNQLRMYDPKRDSITSTIRASSPIISYNKVKEGEYLTQIGHLNPSEIASGSFSIFCQDSINVLQGALHRPVHTLAEDLDDDGDTEFVISEFGHFTGKVRLLSKANGMTFESKTLLNQPGVIRILAEDMNNDGKKDLVILTSQGDESITILYQTAPLEFRRETPIRFSPVYGSSWFEVMDYDNDGDMDIATVHGDNADKSYVQKPYHGLRIHLNDGKNNFKEVFFYALNGATRLLARDFDQDGDTDFAIIATFPDYEQKPERSFVYLENKEPENFIFSTSTFQGVQKARWFLMEAGDIDLDGDLDIILSSFSYSFIPIPKPVEKRWKENDIDIMLLENNLNQ